MYVKSKDTVTPLTTIAYRNLSVSFLPTDHAIRRPKPTGAPRFYQLDECVMGDVSARCRSRCIAAFDHQEPAVRMDVEGSPDNVRIVALEQLAGVSSVIVRRWCGADTDSSAELNQQ